MAQLDSYPRRNRPHPWIREAAVPPEEEIDPRAQYEACQEWQEPAPPGREAAGDPAEASWSEWEAQALRAPLDYREPELH